MGPRDAPGKPCRARPLWGVPAALSLVLWLSLPARADLSLVQIVQSQTSAGEDGLFGKTWVQVSGRRMRLVSGSARKHRADKEKQKDPVRIIQVLDLDKGGLLELDPGRKTYEERPITEVRYAGSLGRLAPGRGGAHVRSSDIEVERGLLDRKVGDAVWGHYRIAVKLRLVEPGGFEGAARMEQDVWVAPVAGELQKGLMDLVAFENDYRRAAGSPFSPLDHWTYQMREVAAYLGVPEGEVREVLRLVREAFADVPGYPLATAIAWWKQRSVPAAKPLPAPSEGGLRRVPSFYPERARFQPIDFGGSWRMIDGLLEAGAEPGRPRRAPKRRYGEYPAFQKELRKLSSDLELKDPRAKDDRRRSERRERGEAASPPMPLPFYQINTELDAFSFKESIPADDFAPPAGFRPAPKKRPR